MRHMIMIAAVAALSATAAAAETERQLGPHEHGHGNLDLAIEGGTVQMELEVPGADIVGFEHEVKTQADQAKIAAAKETLSRPLALFALPEAAGCTVTAAKIALAAEGAEAHEHGHEPDADEHGATHAEFHAHYTLSCANVAAITTIAFPYFETFPNAQELAVTLITEKAQKAFEVSRDHALIDIRGMM